jgi:hypothetical protein
MSLPGAYRVHTYNMLKKTVILSDSEGSSTVCMAAIQSEEDPSFLRMTNGFVISLSETLAFIY